MSLEKYLDQQVEVVAGAIDETTATLFIDKTTPVLVL
jgi:hypothetical protein